MADLCNHKFQLMNQCLGTILLVYLKEFLFYCYTTQADGYRSLYVAYDVFGWMPRNVLSFELRTTDGDSS